MKLRDSIIETAVNIRRLEQAREELLAELDRLVLCARDPIQNLDEAILAILASDPGGQLSADAIAGEVADLVHARVVGRLEALAEQGLIERVGPGRYGHAAPLAARLEPAAQID